MEVEAHQAEIEEAFEESNTSFRDEFSKLKNSFCLAKYRQFFYQYQHLTYLNLESQLTTPKTKSTIFFYLSSMTNLTVLSLRQNRLENSDINHYVGFLRRLRSLSLQNNSLTSLPMGLKFCDELEEIDLRENRFTALPFVLTSLPKLKTVLRERNRLEDSYRFLRVSMSARIQREELKTDYMTTISLQSLALEKALSVGAIFKIPSTQIPHLFIQLISASRHIVACEYCLSCFLGVEFHVVLFPPDIVGIQRPPMRAITCSEQCAVDIVQHWDHYTDDTLPPACGNHDLGVNWKSDKYVKGCCVIS